MDTLEGLGKQLSQITMYDIKSAYNQAKNIVLNVSEMEAKVREATNDDTWGASSTLMTEISQGTFNYQQFNEIMPCIYSRFMEKEARQWRQIYKALQLLEYLIKHGSERVVDDARSHLGTIKMLRSFHYIDEKGKDQGINIRNRAREIVELLGDLDRVRSERKKAKQNRGKYTGTGNDEPSFMSGGSRYGGFGSDSGGFGSSSGDRDGWSGSGGWSGGVSSTSDFYSNHGSSSSRSGGFRDSSRRQEYDEYDAGDDDVRKAPSSPPTTTRQPVRRSTKPEPAAAPAPAPAPVFDLLGGFDDSAPAQTAPVNKALPVVAPTLDDDDFGDFASGGSSAPAPAPGPAPAITPAKPPTTGGGANVFDMLNSAPAAPAVRAAPMAPASFGAPMKPTYGTGSMGGFGAPSAAPMFATPTLSPSSAAKPTSPPPTSATKASANFDDLWSMSLGSSSAASSAANKSTTAGKSMMDLQKEKAQASIWGASGGAKSQQQQWGAFGGSSGGGGAASGGDDLLL